MFLRVGGEVGGFFFHNGVYFTVVWDVEGREGEGIGYDRGGGCIDLEGEEVGGWICINGTRRRRNGSYKNRKWGGCEAWDVTRSRVPSERRTTTLAGNLHEELSWSLSSNKLLHFYTRDVYVLEISWAKMLDCFLASSERAD